ncbi:aminotransferase class I/II-fold pyridoxal phosphate-dependent enzyme [Bdellovibrionota bacterium FG-2]
MIIARAKRLEQVSEYYFSKKLEEIRQMRSQGKDVINLGIGSPDLAPSSSTLTAAAEALHSSKNHGYGSYRSTPELRAAMAEFYHKTYGVGLNPNDEILPLLGSKEGIFYISMAFLDPGDGVLVPNPGYPAYSAIASLVGAKIHTYDLTAENGWLPDFQKLEEMNLTGCKLMWVNYPHMPTGTQADKRVFEKLIAFGKSKGILICNDNPYSLVLNPEPPLSLLSADPKLEHCLELNSLSKSFNMAGWRVGMALASREIIDAILQVKSNVDSGMFQPIQTGAIEALKNPEEWHRQRNEIYAERKKVACKIVESLGLTCDSNQVGMFLWAKASHEIPDVALFLDRVLRKHHVFLTPGFIFGSNGVRYVRCSLCAPVDLLEEALRRVNE